ncbi:RHS repeat-associated core domain-containing protein [Comamonas sp. SY3]|uniref:RHS repeat-associated core domain-containing protein n=1 Tax=Comamonas sp. SY3 TaxID=3243601 RepID=UPI0035938C56
MTYNPTGTLATLTQPSGLAYSYSYDGAHRLTGWSSNRGESGSFALDPLGNRLSEEIKDASGQAAWVSAQTVNSLNRVDSETIGLNQSTSLTYDANGDLATTSNGLNQTTTLEVDRLRRLSKIIDPLNNSASISYNQLGDISQAKDFKRVATTYTRDALGNVRQEGSPDAGTSTSTYDASGLLASTTDATGRTIGMDRDALGRITEIHYNDGTSSMLRYDLVGAPYNTASAPNASIGQLSEIQDPGVTTQFQRDTLGRVLRKTQILASGTTLSVAYTYVPAGQGGAGNVQTITYPSGKQLSYQYDASGSIVSAVGAGEHYLHYGANGRIAKVTTATASSTDPNAVSYLYNSASQRLLKTDARQSATSPHTEFAMYSEEDSSQLLGVYSNERSANSAAAAGEMDSTEVIYLPTAQGLLPIATQINGRLYAIHSDHLNTPRRLTNADGQVAWQWLVTGFGEVKPTTGAQGYLQMDSAAAGTVASYAPEVTFNLRYPGQQWDEETGLAFNVNRYYNPQDGRYIQADPIGLDGGWNRFAYVAGNPLNAIDPQGKLAFLLPFVPLVVTGSDLAIIGGAGFGAWLGWNVTGPMFIKPPANAYDPEGPKAPGKPGASEGFKDPKGGENWIKNPNDGKGGSSWGWEDANGDVWCPTGPGGRAHGGPHWDVQTPGGGYRNVRPAPKDPPSEPSTKE